MQGPGFNLQYLKKKTKKKNPEGNKDYQCLNACLPRMSAKTNNKKEPRKFVLTDLILLSGEIISQIFSWLFFLPLFLDSVLRVVSPRPPPPVPLRLGLTVSQAAFEHALTLQV